MRRSGSSARVRAVQVLREVLERGGRSKELLADRARGLAPEDSDLLRAIVLGVLRHRSELDAELSSVSRVPLTRLAPNLREILEVALYQIRFLDRVPDHAAVDEAVMHAKRGGGPGAGGLVNAVLRNLLRQPLGLSGPAAGETSAERLARRFSHPEFLVSRWLARFGPEKTLDVLLADNAPSGVDLLTNPRRTSRESLAAELSSEGVQTIPSSIAPLALTVTSGNPFRSPLFDAGRFSIQDVASQALALLLPPGGLLVDLAAAPGGKSFSAIFHGRALQALALDRSAPRLRLVAEGMRRLGVPEILVACADFRSPPLVTGRFDRVLLDAPCSGTGTLRKNPEIRYRVSADAIEKLSAVQQGALAAATELLSPGGFLLYSTCSLEEEENERVVARALARKPELQPSEIEAPGELAPFVSGSRFRILPGPFHDGFTAHLLRRRGG